ncbi:MAG: hypothetical protein QM639_04410 [Rhodocyclaceae bacterium]
MTRRTFTDCPTLASAIQAAREIAAIGDIFLAKRAYVYPRGSMWRASWRPADLGQPYLNVRPDGTTYDPLGVFA